MVVDIRVGYLMPGYTVGTGVAAGMCHRISGDHLLSPSLSPKPPV